MTLVDGGGEIDLAIASDCIYNPTYHEAGDEEKKLLRHVFFLDLSFTDTSDGIEIVNEY